MATSISMFSDSLPEEGYGRLEVDKMQKSTSSQSAFMEDTEQIVPISVFGGASWQLAEHEPARC